MTRRTLWILLIALLAAVVPATVLAQTEPTIETMRVQVWPEFDQPAVLVLINGQAAERDPVELSFTLPATASLNAVAYIDPTGDLLNADFTEQGNGINISSPNGSFHIEYYDSALAIDSTDRSYEFTLPADYAIANLSVEIQQPMGSESFSMSPEAGSSRIDQFGLTNGILSRTDVLAGETLAISVNYSKSTDVLTVDQLQAAQNSQPAAPVEQPEPTAAASQSVPTGVIIVAGVLVIALAGTAVYVFTSRTVKPARSQVKRAAKQASGSSGRFCTNCGKSIERRDRFCRHCGTAVT